MLKLRYFTKRNQMESHGVESPCPTASQCPTPHHSAAFAEIVILFAWRLTQAWRINLHSLRER